MKVKAKHLKQPRFFFVMSAPSDGSYKFPTITIMRSDPNYPGTCDNLFTIKYQTDNQIDEYNLSGFYRVPYGPHISLDMGYYTDEAMRMLNKLLKLLDHDKTFMTIGSALYSMGLERRKTVRNYVDGNRYHIVEVPPRYSRGDNIRRYCEALKNIAI